MKRPIGSNARDYQDRSKKDCVCGGHSSKARKPRRKDKHQEPEAERKTFVLWCPPKCSTCGEPIMKWRTPGEMETRSSFGEQTYQVCRKCVEMERMLKIAKALMED